jgi:hypothetical protein
MDVLKIVCELERKPKDSFPALPGTPARIEEKPVR